MDEEDTVFELSDIFVDTVGLVSAGAIGENFFLRKSKYGGDVMSDVENSVDAVEVIELDTPSFWNKMTKVFTDALSQSHKEDDVTKEDVEKVESEPTIVEPTPVAEVVTPETVGKVEEETTVVVEEEKVDKVVEKEAPQIPDLSKAMDKIEEALAKRYNAEIADLKQRLEKSETEATANKEKAAEDAMIQKARQFSALPVRYDELGKNLYAISKSVDSEKMEWLVSVLEAVDKQLGAAGILNEIGTTKSPNDLALEEKVDKIAKEKDIPYSEALLTLPDEEQKQVLAQMRG